MTPAMALLPEEVDKLIKRLRHEAERVRQGYLLPTPRDLAPLLTEAADLLSRSLLEKGSSGSAGGPTTTSEPRALVEYYARRGADDLGVGEVERLLVAAQQLATGEQG